MQFHEKLKEFRKGKQLTQEELAERIHVSRSAVAKWENGLGLPSEESLEEIAVFFGVNSEDLLADREMETVIVGKNGKISQQNKLLIAMGVISCVIFIASVILLGAFLGLGKVAFFLLITITVVGVVWGAFILLLYDRDKKNRSKKISWLITHIATFGGVFISAWVSAKATGGFYPINYFFLAIVILLVVAEFIYCIFAKKIYNYSEDGK